MLGKKIAELRKLHHYSQESLAEQMNVSRQTISKWETDLSVQDIERIIKLSEIFHVSLNELLQINQEKAINHEEITIIDNDLYIQKIDYHIFYKDKEIKKGLLVNQFKEKMYQAEIPIDIAHIGNNQLIKVIVDVYDDRGNKYSIYDHSISRTRGMIGMSSIESQNELTLSE
ncbi:MAG: helix-turn-helix transcriptional regulator [Coprobacillus sp.]|nr:helix-turn-helix transcriptional regulator [Coprobacillus sp.]